MSSNEDVDAWFENYDNPMKEVVRRIREIVLGADARIGECIKWQAPTFAYRGNLASFFPKSKAHASLMFHVGAKIPGTHPRLEGTGATSRVLKIGSVQEADAARGDIERIVRAWCEWRDSETVDAARESTGAKKLPRSGKSNTRRKSSASRTPRR
ncbi:MAG: DUF1801 domain-containing protein [Deltaproteobacteria bacterium]|nr:DUF1801 domain-containing protein [Deltaproteobacteria bacterium]